MTLEQTGGTIRTELETQADHPLVGAAIMDAYSRLPREHTREAEARIEKGIRNRLGPAIIEHAIVSDQLLSPEYQEWSEELLDFFEGAIVGDVECPDGRINPYFSILDPNVLTLHQRPAGIPETRPSTSNPDSSSSQLGDGSIIGALFTAVRARRARYDNPELVQKGGPHINSADPLHGCGAMKNKIEGKVLATSGMRHGGIARYYEDLGEGFFAFDNLARNELKIPSTTFDVSHDAYSQGLILGLRNAHPQFDKKRSLRENLQYMHKQRQVLMTEHLDLAFRERIQELDSGDGRIDPFDSNNLANNLIRIGRIAKTLAEEEEKTGFGFISGELIGEATPVAKRVLAYMFIRNVVYRNLANIQPGNHSLLEHNERWMRVGSKGPINFAHVPFVLRTKSGSLSDNDIDNVFALEVILRGALTHEGVKPEDEATVIVVGANFNPETYASPGIAAQQRDDIFSNIGNEAARIRNERSEDIYEGNRVVLGALYGPDKTISEIVR